MGHEKVARLPFAFAFGYCIHFCIYAMLRTRATFSWPILYTKYCHNVKISEINKIYYLGLDLYLQLLCS